MHYLFDEVLERLKAVPGFEACSDTDTHRGLVLKKNVALAWLFSKNILDESAFTPVK